MRRVTLTPASFPGRVLLRGFEGGAVYTAERNGKFYVIIDESSMADFLSDEDIAGMELVKVLEFDTRAARAAYVLERGWSTPAAPSRPQPTSQESITNVDSRGRVVRETANKKTRVYGELRDIIERRGGSMTWRRQGYRYGAWEIALDGKLAIIEATGSRKFPALDRLYVPKFANPKTWDDYSDELVADAEHQLCALLV